MGRKAMPKSDKSGSFITDVIAGLIGWGVCMAVLVGAYMLGYFVALYLGIPNRETIGLLSAVAVVWMYEHQIAHDRWNRALSPGSASVVDDAATVYRVRQ
jgi:hypothetical protein